jgi:hypothetical protein
MEIIRVPNDMNAGIPLIGGVPAAIWLYCPVEALDKPLPLVLNFCVLASFVSPWLLNGGAILQVAKERLRI